MLWLLPLPPVLDVYHTKGHQFISHVLSCKLSKPPGTEDEVGVIPLTVVSDHNLCTILVAELWMFAPHLVACTAARAVSIQPRNSPDIAAIKASTKLTIPACSSYIATKTILQKLHINSTFNTKHA